jgi:hypothetical protein
LNKFIKIANSNGFLVGELPLPEGESGLQFDFTVPYPIDPIQWYLWLKNANGFIGLRFHAIVCCIVSGTPFFSMDVYGNHSLFIRGVNKLGLYKLGRMFDCKSKIYQLLRNTEYRNNRVNSTGLFGISPENTFRKMIKLNRNDIVKLGTKFKKDFLNIFNNINI